MTKRARAIALARRKPDPFAWLPWLMLLSLLLAGAAVAQPAPQSSTPLLPPNATQPDVTPVPRADHPDTPDGTTKDGVAVPRANPDPGIVAPTPTPGPATGGTVIPPPGTPGGNPQIIPKP